MCHRDKKNPDSKSQDEAAKRTEDEKLIKTQNDAHNIKREALGPNAGRNQNN